jgi:SH3-like domain-containing protein
MNKIASALLLSFAATAAPAFEYRSVASPAAVLYDGPSAKAEKISIVTRAYPLEIITKLGEWVKVRDAAGELGWIDAKALADKRFLLVTAATADIRESAENQAPLVLRVEKNVVLELLEPPASSWAKVRHRDGVTGFVRSDQVWGL